MLLVGLETLRPGWNDLGNRPATEPLSANNIGAPLSLRGGETRKLACLTKQEVLVRIQLAHPNCSRQVSHEHRNTGVIPGAATISNPNAARDYIWLRSRAIIVGLVHFSQGTIYRPHPLSDSPVVGLQSLMSFRKRAHGQCRGLLSSSRSFGNS